MNVDKFQELSKETIKECFRLLTDKGHDYTSGNIDALANFKLVSERTGLTPLQVWSVYFSKHIDALFTYIKKGQLKSETVESRIHDAINYLLLFNGLVKEQKESQIQINEKL